MYSDYFGLSDSPFAITPDPRYLFLSQRHQEALAHLLFGVKEGGGFVQLTGEVGTGKTMLIRALLEQLDENVDVALILNPRLTAFEFVASLCDDLHISYPQDTSSLKVLISYLNDFLLRAHAQRRRVILIVDEA
ncbi:MAG: AAA family ATPase, partial [Gammaproteobacteria bacterium]|nr:AAA family ATPase [Gammaproteobacteria bacterium]